MSNSNHTLPSPLPIHDPSIHASIEVMNSSMQQIFHLKPNHFQQQIIPKILLMMKNRLQPRPLLLVQSNGGGKSAVPQTCGCCNSGGFTIILENTQALGADDSTMF